MSVEKVAEYLLSIDLELSLSKKNNLLFKNRPLSGAVFSTLKKSLNKSQLIELVNLCKPDYASYDYGEMDSELLRAIESILKNKKIKKLVDVNQIFDAANPIPLKDIRIVNNVEDLKSSLLYNPNNQTHYIVDPLHISKKIAFHFPDELDRAVWAAEHTDDRILRYQPFEEKLFEIDGRLAFNKWSQPKYLQGFKPVKTPEPPEDFLKVFNHLFVEESERKYVLSWIKTAVTSREKTVLILTGMPGSGKGVIFDHLLKNLVGPFNWTKAAANFDKSEFHGDIRGKQIFLLNEISLKKATKDKLKDLADGSATLNEKFLKNSDAEPIHASFVLANNYPHENYLEYSDRKFYVPKLSDVKLDDVFGVDWVTNFCEETCKDIDFLRAVYSYLVTDVRRYFTYPKTALFYKICQMSLPHYFKRFLKLCEYKKQFTDRDLSKGYKGTLLNCYELSQTLETYQKETKQAVAEILETPTGWVATSHISKNSDDIAV